MITTLAESCRGDREEIMDVATDSECVVAHRWRVGDVVLWDNRYSQSFDTTRFDTTSFVHNTDTTPLLSRRCLMHSAPPFGGPRDRSDKVDRRLFHRVRAVSTQPTLGPATDPVPRL